MHTIRYSFVACKFTWMVSWNVSIDRVNHLVTIIFPSQCGALRSHIIRQVNILLKTYYKRVDVVKKSLTRYSKPGQAWRCNHPNFVCPM